MQGERIQYTIGFDADISAAKASMDSLQKTFSNFGVSSKFGEKINQEFAKFGKAYETYMTKVNAGIKNKGDYTAVTKSLNEMKSAMAGVAKEAVKIGNADPLKAFKNDKIMSGLLNQIDEVQKKISNFKFDPKSLSGMADSIKAAISKNNTNIPNLLDQIQASNKAGNYDQTISGLNKLQNALQLSKQRAEELAKSTQDSAKAGVYEARAAELDKIIQKIQQINPSNLVAMKAELESLLTQASDRANTLANSWQDFTGKVQQSQGVIAKTADSLQKIHKEEFGMQRQIEMVDRQIQSYFGLTQILRKVMNIAKQAMSTVKELDKAMTETAVVTNFDVGDMWEKLPQYTAMANQLGATINDVYKATTLYYQQGLNMSQAMGIAEQTLKMARIGGIDAAEATNMMTAALRGFNMQINEMSAQRVNDVYSKVAAMSASNTKELGEAMERTASIANSAGMEFGNTTAFLAQMIETTREAPENLGTAMKTIVARFQEMKKNPAELIDVEGEMLDVNRVDKALKSVGIALTDTEGSFRNLDQVFLEISAKWDQLSMGQQRYIATMAAGSRQQSRFIALMGNHERLMELVDGANNSAGASQEQFNKTLDSFATKANKLKNAWDQFTMGLLNDKLLKGAVDSLTSFMTVINKIIDVLSSATGPFKGFTKSILTLVAVMGSLSVARKGISAGVLGIFDWWSGKTTMGQMFNGVKTAAAQGTLSGNTYVQEAAKAVRSNKTLTTAINEQWNQKALDKLRDKKNYQTIAADKSGHIATVGQQMAAMMTGDLSTNVENMASITGGMMQSLFNNESFAAIGSQDGIKLINDYATAFKNAVDAKTPEERAAAGEKLTKARQDIVNGMINSKKPTTEAAANKAIEDALANKAQVPTAQLDSFVSGVSKATNGVSQLGMLLQNTPLAPFGKLLTTAGMAASAFAGIMTGLVGTLANVAASSLLASGALVTETGAVVTDTMWAKMDAAAKWKLIAANHALGASILHLIATMLPFAAVAATVWLLYKAFTYNAKQLQTLHDRAAAASDAYKSVKQEVSELKDNLNSLDEYDDAFKTLVSGTAEFNSKLVESNELITELIKKYPMLESEGYVTTDQNGRMQISQAGKDAVKQLMTERQAKAQAIDIFANADYKKEQARQDVYKTKEYEEAYHNENKGVSGRYWKLYKKANQQDIENKGLDTTDKIIAKAEEKATAQVRQAQKAAVSAMISSQKDLINRESVSQVIGEGYDQLIDTIEADSSGKDRAKAYAEAYGYEYISGNKFKDQSGNEVEVSKEVWNDETTNKRIKANNQIIESAGLVDRALVDLDGKVSDVFSDVKIESDSLISDILSSNINTNRDDLEKIADSGKLKELYNSLSENEQQALKDMGIDDFEAYAQERIQAIKDAQAQQDIDLAAMMARATGKEADWLSSGTRGAGEQIKALRDQLSSLSQEEKHFATETGQSLEEAFGASTSDKFVKTFVQGSNEIKQELQTVFDGVDWSSSIDALGGVQAALESNQDEVVKLGEAMQNSAEGSHLLNDAMQEMYAAEDFTKAMENLDNFVDESGKLSAVGIQKMAEESGTLAKMLDTGAISAGGLAAAINAVSVNGVVDITDLSDSVLKLIGYFGELDDSIAKSHDYIENFDAGIDTGESKDFITENIEKINEYVKNGEWGNDQLHNYIQSIIGTEAWENALQQSGQNYQKAYNLVKNQVQSFSKGYDKMWGNLAKGLDSTGKAFNKSEVYKKLGWDKEDKGISFQNNGKGQIELKLNGHDLDDLNKYIQEVEHVGEEQANNIIQDWRNYSPQFDQQVREQSFKKGLTDQSFAEAHEYNGNLVLTKSELQTLADVSNKSRYDTASLIEDQTGEKVIKNSKGKRYFNNMENGQLRDDYKPMAEQFNKYLGLAAGKSFAFQKEFKNEDKTGYDVEKIIGGYLEKGFTQLQAQGMAFEQMKANGNKTFTYNGKTVDPSQFNNVTEFLESLTEIDQNVQWEAIGEAIAKGILEGINGNTDESGAPDTTNEGYSDAEKQAAEKQKTADAVKIQSLEADIKSYQAQIEAKEQEVKDAKAEVEAAKEEAKNAKKDKDEAEQKVADAEKKLNEAKESLADLRVLLKTTQDELGKYKKNGPQKGTSKSDETPAEEATETDITVNYKANTEEIDFAQQKLDSVKDKEVTLTVHADGVEELNAATNAITNLASAARQNKTVKSNVTINSKKGSTQGIQDIKTAATNEKGAIVKVTTNTVPGVIEVNSFVSWIKRQSATLNINPDFGPEANWERAVKVKVKVRKGGKIDEGTGGKVHANGAKGSMPKFAGGGSTLTAFVPEGTDTVPAMLTPGEFVQRRRAVNYFGNSFMENINQLNLRGALNSLNRHQLSLGSAAKGSRSHGTIGPKDHGGLTLTGERGYEIAWIPSQNRSMILGANGPEMVNLPNDTVVWNHKESQNIIKKKDIPNSIGGSAAIGAGSMDDSSTRQIPADTASSNGSKKSNNSNSSNTVVKKAGKAIKLITQKGGKLSVWWENQTRKVDAILRKVEKQQTKVDKLLDKTTSTIDNISKATNSYIKTLNQSITLNTQSKNKAESELKSLDKNGKAKISYDVYQTTFSKKTRKTSKYKSAKKEYDAAKKAERNARKTKSTKDDKKAERKLAQAKKKLKKIGKTTKKTKKKKLNIGKYIIQDPETGAYIVDQAAIDKLAKKNKSKAKAIEEAAYKKIDEKTQKKNAAEDNIQKAKDALDELSKKLYDTFLGWENELTRIYILTKQLESTQKRTSELEGAQALQDSMLNSGLQQVTERFLGNSQAIFQKILDNNLDVIKLNNEQIELQKQAAEEALSVSAINQRIQDISSKIATATDDTQLALYKEALERAQTDLVVANKAMGYMSSKTNGDGTYTIDFDSEQLEKDILNGNISSAMGEGITNFVNKAIEASDNLTQLYTDQLAALQNMYDTLADLREQYADYADELVAAIDNANQKEIDKLSKLNDTLTNKLKDLLDEVKRRLDQRRQQEDNAKTESDLIKKQQRLATLRADTSGGRASEIAQLEKEIAEAQQNYGRTLEDQTLQRLEEQADEASKQRERMISLLEAMAELAKDGNNVDLVNKYLSNPEENKAAILELWRENNDYYNQTKARQDVLDANFETFFKGISILPNEIETTEQMIGNLQPYVQSMSVAVAGLVMNSDEGETELEKLTGIQTDTITAIGTGFSTLMGANMATLSDVVDSLTSLYGNDNETILKILESMGIDVKAMHDAGIPIDVVGKIYNNDWEKLYNGGQGYSLKQLQQIEAKTEDLVKLAEDNKAIDQSTGAKLQQELGTSSQTTQQMLTAAGETSAAAMAGVAGKMDMNGKKKGGKIGTHINESGTYEVGNKGSTLYFQEYDTEKGTGTGKITSKKISQISEATAKSNPIEVKQALEYAITHQTAGTLINKNIGALVKAVGIANKAYTIKKPDGKTTKAHIGSNGIIWYGGKSGVYKWDPSKKAAPTLDKYNKTDFIKIAKGLDKNSAKYIEYAQALRLNGVKGYKSGGMNYTTGPAWLDGTRAKPEAVLNATETKNFIALKDILSDVMGHIDNTNSTTYGDSTWEININVDHLNNDYDVDKVAKRVEKIITDNASYRNVTMVRKFR